MNNTFSKIISSHVLFALSVTSVLALSPSQAGRIIENWKVREKSMVFESDANFLDEGDTEILKTYRKLNVYENIGENIRSKREYLEEQSEKITSRVNSLEEAIKQLNTDIDTLVKEIDKINDGVIEVKKKIDTNKRTIDILKNRISNNTEILMEYIVYVYKKGDVVSSQNDIDSFKSILLSGENIDDIINDLYFKSIMQVTGKQLIDKHRAYISELYIKRIELQNNEDELKTLRKQGVIEKKTLDDKRAAKKRILEVTRGQEALYQKYIAEKIEAERDIKEKELQEQIKLNNTKKELLAKYGCEFVDISTQQAAFNLLTQECQNINKIIFSESRISGVGTGDNPFDWPVPPFGGITAYYRDEGYRRELGTDHDAIDLRAAQGTPIKAPMDGYVLFIQPPVNTGYAYVAIKHSDGLVTLYGHVSEVNVQLYDFVKRGEVFAKSGGAYGTLGAGVLSTGPHLHFVVYEDQEYVDPLEYLDISYLDFDSLPDRYEYKYKNDFKKRKGLEFEEQKEGSNKFVIKGDNEVERQKYLLNTYAVGGFRNWDVWVEESVEANIDPSFMMCVGLAETTLGKYMKSKNNIGNVGNNDRGDTVDFDTPRQGIHWMTKTFNNKFLGGYTELNQLSRYGNKNGTIYASSEFNWHNNITKCLSHIKGEYVPDDFEFRIN